MSDHRELQRWIKSCPTLHNFFHNKHLADAEDMDSTSAPTATSYPGVLHVIPPNLSAFEPSKPLVKSVDINTLLWIGGMFDVLGSVTYPFTLCQSLGPTWSLVTCSLSSAGMSWGVKSISTDAEDMAKIITYIQSKRPGGKIVIMGHSTGCQDCMEYVVGKGASMRPQVDGVILQAPVSDREALENELPAPFKYEADQLALRMCREGREKDAMPNRLTKPVFGRLAITARRWVDVSSPGPDHAGADDYFSSDLSGQRLKTTFGNMPARAPLLILHSGNDESIPARVDKHRLIKSWTDMVKLGGGSVDEANSGVVLGATHNYNTDPEEVRLDMIRRVLGFIYRLEQGTFNTPPGISRI